MATVKPDYEFLDLSDVKEADLTSLQSALSKRNINDTVAAHIPPTNKGPGPGPGTEGECEMSPQSPARGQPVYAPYPPPQWHAPPNVYVSQVTANVNVHGYSYMGQYYGAERGRGPRRDRRAKRAPSPPAPCYLYPPCYPQQGAPLYHLPVYQPLVYPYQPYPPYYPDYHVPIEGEDKPPEEYPPEMVMEGEAVEYYAPYNAPPYPPEEYMPPVYLPPPPPVPHQFNVHAKNFVLNQNKQYAPPPPAHVPAIAPAPVSAPPPVESLPMKDLKISKGPGSPKHNVPQEIQPKSVSPVEKVSPAPKMEAKPVWIPPEVKPTESVPNVPAPTNKNFPPVTVSAAGPPVASKVVPQINKVPKGPAAPFSGTKQPVKPSVPPPGVPVQQAATATKPPFANRQKREGANRSPSTDTAEEKVAPPVEHVKREPPLPPSKAPMPISITLHSGPGAPLIVHNKPPFGHPRKPLVADPAPAPPPAPTASDFPPPPVPRRRSDQPPAPAPQQPQPAPGKSWASLFNKTSTTQPAPVAVEEPPSPTTINPPATQKPVAKVLPYDASPLLQTVAPEKPSPVTKPVSTSPPTISYSEKTSVNAVSTASTSVKPSSPQTTSEVREIPIHKESTPALPVHASPFADDPNSYRMGEFLCKYQLDTRPVALLPRGLTNRSNYCYVNAILQALIACPPFYNMLKALPYQTRRGKSSTPVIDAMVELCYEFTPLPPNARVSRSRGGEGSAGPLPIQTGPPLDPSAGQKVLRALRPFPGSQEGRQEDAEEFLGCLLNGLNDEMLELMKLVEPEEVKEAGPPNGVAAQEQIEEDDDDEWKVMGPRKKGLVERRWAGSSTPLSDVFRGRTRCRLLRAPPPPHCHLVTDAVQPFFTLQLDITRSQSVKEALEALAGKDAVEGVTDAWQQLSIEQLPVVLLLHLKCFQLDPDGHPAKIVKTIDFPIDLKIDPKILSPKLKYGPKQRMYKLFAVVYHEGVEAIKGHYLTDTYHGQAGWIRYDDSTVTLVNDTQVLKPKPPRMPYLLMYRRQDTLPVPQHRKAE